jgi:RNA polymerase-binding transcription factor DksA
VGHADKSQQIVREQVERRGFSLPTNCPHCGAPIPKERRLAAWESGNQTVYCSTKCRQKGGKKARHARRAAYAIEFAAWLEGYEGDHPR